MDNLNVNEERGYLIMKTIRRGIALIMTSALLAGMITLSGCGKPKGVKELLATAEKLHGACSLVSEMVTDDHVSIVVHDSLQDFDYECESFMEPLFENKKSDDKIPVTKDNFDTRLREKILDDHKPKLDKITENHEARLQLFENTLYVYCDELNNAQKVSVKVAEIFQGDNMKHRLDGMEICAQSVDKDKSAKDEQKSADEQYGYVILPSTSWVDDPSGEYTLLAQKIISPKVRFVRREKKTFEETGVKLDRVFQDPNKSYPTSPTSEVIFYYFAFPNGLEYFICNFEYYTDPSQAVHEWYTNYRR